MSPDLQKILRQLNRKYGETQTSRIHKTEYIAIHKTKRKEAIWILVNALKRKGKEIEYFESRSFQDDLADFFFPEGSSEGLTKIKRDGARAVIFRELNEVIAKAFPDDDLFEDLPPFEPNPKSAEPEETEEKSVKFRPDVSTTPYKADEWVEDEEFERKLKELEEDE